MKLKPLFLLGLVLLFVLVGNLLIRKTVREGNHGGGGRHGGGGGGGRYGGGIGRRGGGVGRHGGGIGRRGGGVGRNWDHGKRYNHYYGGNYSSWGSWSPLLLYYYIYPDYEYDYDYDYYYVPVDDPYGLVPVDSTVSTYGPTPVYRYYPWM
jgi:hypothetical protein